MNGCRRTWRVDLLSDESMVEGWLKVKIRSRRVAVQAGGQEVGDRGPLAAGEWDEDDEELRGPRLWEMGQGVWADAGMCVYSRLLAGSNRWPDVMNEKGEMEDIRTMETRTCRKWSAAEKKEYHSLRQQLTSEHMRGGSLGQKWRAQCICWEEKGRRPKSGVRADDSVQRLRQQGWIWDVEDVERARRAPACWGGWEYIQGAVDRRERSVGKGGGDAEREGDTRCDGEG